MKNKKFKLKEFKWLLLISNLIVIGAVMSFGIILIFPGSDIEEPGLLMLSMILPMMIVAGEVTLITILYARKRMGLLLDAITRVSEGDLDVQLELKNSGEYKVIYETFNHMTSELKNTKMEMQTFVNDFSHEFKTPITSVSGFAKHLVETGEDIETPERMEYLKIIQEEAERLSTLAQSTLLMRKLEACQVIPDQINYNLTEQLRHCVIMLLPLIEEKEIDVNLEEKEIYFFGNYEFMEQVWINLLQNAIKFTNRNGSIDISIVESSYELIIAIEDDGIGMSEETMKQIFDKKHNIDCKSLVEGNGIGLSIVQRIVTLCNGSITVESKINKGSKFCVRLPKPLTFS